MVLTNLCATSGIPMIMIILKPLCTKRERHPLPCPTTCYSLGLAPPPAGQGNLAPLYSARPNALPAQPARAEMCQSQCLHTRPPSLGSRPAERCVMYGQDAIPTPAPTQAHPLCVHAGRTKRCARAWASCCVACPPSRWRLGSMQRWSTRRTPPTARSYAYK